MKLYIYGIKFFEKHWYFTGSFTDNCQNESISASLLTLIHRITGSSYDPHSKNKLTENTHIPLLSLLQLIHFNTIRQRRNSGTSRHTSVHYVPLSVYVALSLPSQKRRPFLVDKFHDLALSISYDPMFVLLTQLGNSAYMQFESNGVICAIKLCSNVFTIFDVDNIDHNPSSRSWHENWFLVQNSNYFNTALQVKDRWDKSLFCPFSKHWFNSFAASLKVIHASAPLCFQINRLLCSTSSYKERFGTIWRLIDLVPCTIEEADQVIFLYVKK